jgi:hypothetical protein
VLDVLKVLSPAPDIVDLALAVVLAASFEGKQLGVVRQVLELGEHPSYCVGLTKHRLCCSFR